MFQQVDHASRLDRAKTLDELLQVYAFQILHRVVEAAVRRAAHVVDRDRIRMRERRRDSDLALEAGQCRLLLLVAGTHDLDRRGATQQRVLRQKDLAHASPGQLFVDQIIAEPLRLEGGAAQTVERLADDRRGAAQYRHPRHAPDQVVAELGGSALRRPERLGFRK